MVAKLCEAEQMPHELPALLSRVQLTQPQAGQKGEGQQKLIGKWKMLLWNYFYKNIDKTALIKTTWSLAAEKACST